jgi:hypothetical protein
MNPTTAPLDNVVLHSDVVAALTLAATRRQGSLTTLDILAALVDVDAQGDWSWVQFESTFLGDDDREQFHDQVTGEAGVWNHVALTPAATEALMRSRRIADDYQLTPLPPGALALGLVWNRKAAATQALLSDSQVDHSQLLEIVQEAVLGTRLEGLASTGDATTTQPTSRFERVIMTSLTQPPSPSGWDDAWQLLETPATRRLDAWQKVVSVAEAVLLAAFCAELVTQIVAVSGWFSLPFIPVAFTVTFAVGPPRRSPLTSLVRIGLALVLHDSVLVGIGLVLFSVECFEFYLLMPRAYAAGHGGPLIPAREASRIRTAGLRNVRASYAQRAAQLMTAAFADPDEEPVRD